jgi:hypothetical protein
LTAELAPSLASDEDFLAWVVRYFRQSASPSAAIAIDRMWFETDARPIVRSLSVPSLVLWRRDAAYAAESRYLAEHVPGAIAVELPGSDHLPWIGDVDRAVDAIEAFLSAVKDEDAVLDRLLATVLFTDIVSSTERARELGDRAWGELLEAHHARVRAQLARFRGRCARSAGRCRPCPPWRRRRDPAAMATMTGERSWPILAYDFAQQSQRLVAGCGAFHPAPVTTHHAQPEPHQRPKQRRHDGVPPQRPGEGPEQELESDPVGVLDDEDQEDPDAGQRSDRPATQFAPVRLLPIRLNRHHVLLR